MGSSEEALIRLGRRIGAEQDEILRRRAPDPEARARLFTADAARRAHPSRQTRKRFVGAALGVAAAACLLLCFVLAQRPLTFHVGAGEGAYAGRAGAFIATPTGRMVPVVFSDGTRLRIQPDSSVRIASVDRAGGRVVLENGALEATVVHHEGTRWLVDSGPFEILVTGTRFHVAWDLAAERLTLHLVEGSVVVAGPILGEGIALRSGDTLEVNRKEGRFVIHRDNPETREAPDVPQNAAEPPSLPEDPPEKTTDAPPPAPHVPRAAPPRKTPLPPAPPGPSWRDLAASGKYKDALEAADREGLDAIYEAGSAADLRDLGDAARLTGDTARAVEAFSALRRRFPADEQAAEAAFLLGIIAFDKQGAHAEAARWFATYLRERPRGRLAREAAGRLLEARLRSGDKPLAREAARAYLRDFPGGPHAEVARAAAGDE
ncbi:FecR domain-containing protein [Polyangium sorediatum]|uniref:FecR domain-containing protein n=1 Tax=Polyangium sorediatum TaxID=889274 RepID=A0ABT6NJP6_9BACT|nr:FecR domain-containing protein [Polyangium sorediatum]MDI1428532.1 FecR domain-containing protein [Polyangium sorediatum]